MSDCELGELLDRLNSITIDKRRSGGVYDQAAWHSSLNMSLEAIQLKALIESAVSSALAVQRENFEERLTTISQRINDVKITVPEVEAYKEIEVLPGRQCDEPLDIVKSLPDFDGKQECYVSWRQAAQTAYKIFEKHEGSSKHFQAVAIIRNKVKGPADMVLASFNTVLNFKAIISRLDFTYSDKRPIYLIEQELSTLRQGSLTLLQYYDEVEKKLTLLTNKTIMTYDKTIAAALNEKYRMDALRVFISGTKKPLCDVLFSARPSDLPSALALAQEVESNHERYLFASTYARNLEDKAQRFEGRQQHREKGTGGRAPVKDFYPLRSPHFNRSQGTYNKPPQKMEPVQPMEVDPSLRYRQSTQHQPNVPFRNWVPPYTNQNEANRHAAKRPNRSSARFTGPKQQRIDHLSAGQECEEYRDVANSEAAAVNDELSDSDQINFLTQNSLLPFVERTIAGRKIKLLIDTGASKNYIKPLKELKNIVPVENRFLVKSIHGFNDVKKKCIVNLFGTNSPFFLLPMLSTFDGIVGLDLLTKTNATLDFKNKIIKTSSGSEELKFLKCCNVNFTQVEDIEVPQVVRNKFQKMIKNLIGVFSDPNEALPYNTNIVATIRTESDDPVYSKLYPYPMGVSDFVNAEIRDLLRNGIIRPSRSPYNNPIWVVDKKGKDEQGNTKKRLVIDFRKLNQKTIDDKYPIPNITVILSNLGKAKYFTTLDLKSGFHQIALADQDREKTAFSVGNGKYEFRRLPFGLKNAPSIFQRAIDDVLREQIGKCCYVYVDDVIIFSEDEEKHVDHIEWVLRRLCEANMRVSREKSHFFKQSVEYLGFVVSKDGIKTSPSKIKAIRDYEKPSTLFNVRSFLGLASYYRCFIKDFASIARPLTDILKGENGKVKSTQSKRVKIDLDEEQLQAFNKLKEVLASEDVILPYPDFKKPFDLTTDASSMGIGAVLSQGGKPITMISRTLKDREKNFATNERELLAIVWALKSLRNYLYGVKNLNIFTDHQPLTFAVSDRNPNAKIKRWKAFIDEHNAKLFYKPGRENYVADALSRQNIHNLEEENRSDLGTIHSETSLSYTIEATEKPLNCFRNQIVLEEADANLRRNFIYFGEKTRHVIQFTNKEHLMEEVKLTVNPNVVNAIHCNLPTLASVQHELIRCFPATKFWYCKSMVADIVNKDEQREIVVIEHNRAHRAAQENVRQILCDYYFPKMTKLANEVVANCKICSKAKYDRHPRKQEHGVTPVPSYAGEILHVDIFSTDKKYFLTCLDKFSKFAVVQPIPSRTILDIKYPIFQLMNIFPGAKTIYCDNEASLNSETIRSLLKNQFNVNIVNAPPLHSTSNGQVERFHSTLVEIARCLKLEKRIFDETIELILLATFEYNRTIHSVTRKKPIDIIHATPQDMRNEIMDRIEKAQQTVLERNNPSRQNRVFDMGERVLVKTNKRLGNKLTPLYVEEKVEADLGTTVLIKGRVVHKDNIK